MYYRVTDEFWAYFGAYGHEIFRIIDKNRKPNETNVAEEIGIENPSDPELNNLWVISQFGPKKNDWGDKIEIIEAIVYDDFIPDIVLDQYNYFLNDMSEKI